ncbi:MAG: caspase family protein [Planctomycetota bacterium]|jgi:hypothetical protein
MKTATIVTLTAGALIPLLAGCSGLPSLDPFELPEGKAIKASVTAPDPARLGVAVAYPIEEWAKSKEDFGHAVKVKVDGASIRSEYADTFRRLGLFQAVEEVGNGAIHEKGREYLADARNQDLDLLLVLRPKQNRVSYHGHNGNYVPSLILWVLFWFPSWWVADEVFASEVTLEGTLYRVKDGKTVHQQTWKGRFENGLDDFQRNWKIWGILRVPGALDTEDYEAVGDTLFPHALNLTKLKAMKDLTGFVKTAWPGLRRAGAGPVDVAKPKEGTKPPREGPTKEGPKPPVKPKETVTPGRRALVIGAGDFRNEKIPAVRFADKDAEVFAESLRKSGYEEKNIRVLTGKDATLSVVRKALETFAEKPGHPEDVRVLYFSGRGAGRSAGAGARLYLTLHDTDPAALQNTALSMTDLWRDLNRCQGKVRLILDTSFSGETAPRGFGASLTGAQEALSRLFAVREGWAFLYGAGEGGGALELDELSGGIFTHFLLEGLSGKAETDGAEGVSVKEIQEYLAQNVTSTADLLGETQNPFVASKTQGAKVIP